MTPTNRIRKLIRRYWLLLTVSVVAVAAVAALAVVLIQRPTEDTSPAASSSATVMVTVETGRGLIAPNHDGEVCVFPELEYQLADASGTLIAADRWEDEGASAGNSQWAAVGQVASTDPYLCRFSGQIELPEAGIYSLIVAAGGAESEVVISEGDRSVTVVLD